LVKLKNIIVVFLILYSVQLSFGQEMLLPLRQNQQLIKQSVNRSIDQNYIYAVDTLHLPFKDDFSKDYFKKYDATPNSTNVTDTMYHAILIVGVPDVGTATYMTDTTFQYNISLIGPNDSVVIDTIAQTSTMVTFCDLDVYPVSCSIIEVWAATVIYDSIGTVVSPDFVYQISPADIEQDSAQVYFVAATDSVSLWQDNNVFLNTNYAINPPTIGVATFDGLDDNGYPYDFSSPTSYGKADYLTSKPIYLGKDENNVPYGIADSVYLSFYYQSQGLGNAPEVEDSLVLQFWSPVNMAWNSVWNKAGTAVDTNFKQVMVPINDNQYFADGFQFRFLNYASLSGSFDHWNIDYVFLESFRQVSDTIRDDVAFTYPTLTLLKDYVAMPWRHYKWNTLVAMADSIITNQRNNNTPGIPGGRLIVDNELNIFYQGVLQQNIVNPNTPSINGATNFTTQFNIATTPFEYDTLVNDTSAIFNVWIKHRTTPDFTRNNDTVFFNQVFEDYYAYDDGSAEVAYGVQGLGGINPKIASKFELAQGDSLKSVKIHFSPSANNMSSSPFILTVWSVGSGGKPGSVLYENISFYTPQYNIGVNGFFEYYFDEKVFVPGGVYFVGWQQTTPNIINVGYDLNRDNNTKSYYNSNGNWQQSVLEGTLMIRPAFVYDKDYIVGVTEEQTKEEFTLYPNPTNGIVNIKGDYKEVNIFNINGRLVVESITGNEIDISSLDTGMYFFKIQDYKDRVSTYKITKK
jgi:hypothetical protein